MNRFLKNINKHVQMLRHSFLIISDFATLKYYTDVPFTVRRNMHSVDQIHLKGSQTKKIRRIILVAYL